MCEFENLVISYKCKTILTSTERRKKFESLVIFYKCKTQLNELKDQNKFESLVIFYKCKNFVIIEVFEGLALRAPF